ncbi:MAG TPA: sulfotransferase domain-containing protein [Terriglobales bacterium]|nr:sulfotransferase domain-containing protein [Terriglobales bacterium]
MALLVRRAFRHLSRVSDVLFRHTLLQREITIFEDDIFLTSYPRSGNTWTRFLVGNFVNPNEPVTFLNVERLVPDMYKTADWVLRRRPRPRVVKSHESFDARYRRVIYIVRDPRDVAISNYHWEMKLRSIPEGCPIEEFVPRWMDGNFWRRIGSWADHVNSWLATRQGHEGFIVMRYEDLQANPQRELARAAQFMGMDPDGQRINRAIELSSAANMRKMEETQGKKWVATVHTRSDKPFVRKASSGGWRTALPEKTVVYMEAHWGPIMKQLGYGLSSETEKDTAVETHAGQ